MLRGRRCNISAPRHALVRFPIRSAVRHDARPASHWSTARPRRHGGGVPRRRHGAGTRGCVEGPARTFGRRSRSAGAFHPGGTHRLGAESSPSGVDLRHRSGHRVERRADPLHLHGARLGRDAAIVARSPRRRYPAAARLHGADCRRTRRRPRRRHRASRPQARERDGRRRRLRETARLRPGQVEGRARPARIGGSGRHADDQGCHRARHRDGHGRIYVARAGARPRRRSPQRYLFVRLHPLRGGGRRARIRRHVGHRHAPPDHPYRSAGALSTRPIHTRRAAAHRQEVPAKGSRGSLPVDERHRRRLEIGAAPARLGIGGRAHPTGQATLAVWRDRRARDWGRRDSARLASPAHGWRVARRRPRSGLPWHRCNVSPIPGW